MVSTDYTPAILERESWAFALELYGKVGVAEACLQLQAEAGVDVMMMIALVFATVRHGMVFQLADVEEFDDACRPWREQVVKPLRGVRVALKLGPPPAPSPASEQLRNQIKASELAAERIENGLLCQLLHSRLAALPAESGAAELPTSADIGEMLNRVVTVAARREGRPAGGEYQLSIGLIADVTSQLAA